MADNKLRGLETALKAAKKLHKKQEQAIEQEQRQIDKGTLHIRVLNKAIGVVFNTIQKLETEIRIIRANIRTNF